MARVVYIIVNYDTNQAYAGLTKRFGRRITEHRNKKPHLFVGNHAVMKTGLLTDAQAQRIEARAVRYLQAIGFHTVNIKKAGGLGLPEELIWTKDRCISEASKYLTRSQFQYAAESAYQATLKGGWLDEACTHMHRLINPTGYWTKERCAHEALKYASRVDFKRSVGSVYNAACRNGWLDDICTHMLRPVYTFWTKDRCADESLKYTTRTTFARGTQSAYNSAKRNGWLDDICRHMPR